MKALTTLLVIGICATAVTMADDVEDVRAAVLGHFDAVNSGDVNAFIRYYASESSVFAGGGLLGRFNLEERRKNFQAGVNAGQKRNLQLRNIEVKIYGSTAIATGYLVGTAVNPPDSSVVQVRMQRTEVLIKQGGQWKAVHNHRSPLLP